MTTRQQSTTATQRATILALLQQNVTVTSVELNRIAYRYSARIHELRLMGHSIQTIRDCPSPRVTTYKYLPPTTTRKVRLKRVRR